MTLTEIKKHIESEGYVINQERLLQDSIINLKITFTSREINKTFEFNSYNVKYVKEICELLSIIYTGSQDGMINPNYGKLILRYNERKGKFPLFIREVFQNASSTVAHWREEDKITAITEYVRDQSFLCSWQANSGTEHLQGVRTEIQYPKTILDVTPSVEDFDRTLIYE